MQSFHTRSSEIIDIINNYNYWNCRVFSNGIVSKKIFFFAGAQGCGRLGDSFLWEGSMFVFQFVGGDGRGHILAQGPQLKISSFGKEKEELKK